MNKQIAYICSLLFIFNYSYPGQSVAKEEPPQVTVRQDEPSPSRQTPTASPNQDEPSAARKPPPVTVNVEIINRNTPEFIHRPQHTTQISTNSASSSHSNAESKSSLRARLSTKVEQRIEQLINLPIGEFAHSLQANAIKHKPKLIAGAAGATYLTTCTFLLFGNQFVNRSDTWASWKKQLSMDEMYQFSQDDLGRDLIRDIQKRHVNVKNPTDHITPLVRFIQAVEYEERLLKRYITLASTLKLCRLTIIVPTNATKIERAHEARRRLMFVKHIFISWTATDNLKNFSH